MPEATIVIKAEDRYSATIKTLSNVTKSFDKNTEHLERTLHELSGEKSVLKAETDKARKAMQEAQKQFAATGDAADGLVASLAGQEFEDYRRKLDAINKTMRETEKQIQSVNEAARKTNAGSNGSRLDTVISTLAASGIGNLIGNLAKEGSETIVNSALGSEIGSIFSSGLSTAISGAAIGSVIPGIGTAVGAIAGAGLGVISGSIKSFEAKDDAFKDYYKSLYETVTQATEEGLTNGKTLAAQRETTKLSFGTLLGGDAQADRFLADVLKTANTTPFLYDDLVSISKTLLSFGYAVEDIIPTLTKVGDAGAAMGLSTADIGTVATYIGRMKSSDKASLEYLNPLNERGLGVFQWLADDLGISQKKVYDKISKGELSGGYVSELILTQFEKLYGDMMEVQSKSTEGLDSTLQGLMENIDAAGGNSYNEFRNQGKQADIAAYGGALGDALSRMNELSGQNKAYTDNMREQYQREALSAVLLGSSTTVFSKEQSAQLEELRRQFAVASAQYDETGSREAAMKMDDLRETAEALATGFFESSDWYRETKDAELELIDAIRENTKKLESATYAYNLSNAFTKGLGVDTTLPYVGTTWGWNSEDWSSNAYGLKRVPYNGYPSILHQDERVLTAAEARERESGGLQVTFSGPITVRQESDLDEIAQRLADKIEQARSRAG